MNLDKNAAISDLTPSDFYLSQNYPNPFSEKTTIKFCVAYRTKVKLEVFNSEGELIEKLLDEEKDVGTYEVTLHAKSLPDCKPSLSSGVYFYQIKAGNYIETKKMILLR